MKGTEASFTEYKYCIYETFFLLSERFLQVMADIYLHRLLYSERWEKYAKAEKEYFQLHKGSIANLPRTASDVSNSIKKKNKRANFSFILGNIVSKIKKKFLFEFARTLDTKNH